MTMHPVVRPATLTPREQVKRLAQADALFLYARALRPTRPDVTARLRRLAVIEMREVVRSRLLAEEWKPR